MNSPEYKADLYDRVYDLNKDHENPYFVKMALVFKREAMKIRAEIKEKTEKNLVELPDNGKIES